MAVVAILVIIDRIVAVRRQCREADMAGAMPNESLSDLTRRRDALRQAAAIPGSDATGLLEAVLTELDGAIETLTELDGAIEALALGAGPGEGQPGEGASEVVRAERHLLYTAFQQAPVPLLLLELDGTIRRANAQAADLPGGFRLGRADAIVRIDGFADSDAVA